jgi:hypothetical protein
MVAALYRAGAEQMVGTNATMEMVSAACAAWDAWEEADRPRGRPWKHVNKAARNRAWYARKTRGVQRKKPPSEKTHQRPLDGRLEPIPEQITNPVGGEKTGLLRWRGAFRAPDPPPADTEPVVQERKLSLRPRLIGASNGNCDPQADIGPIRDLIKQGCDLEADVLPIVAREIPILPRPLKNWGAPTPAESSPPKHGTAIGAGPQTGYGGSCTIKECDVPTGAS